MICHLTESITATKPRARINTLEIAALLGCRTVGVDNTLRATGHIRVTKVFWNTLAGGRTVALRTDSIGAARRRVARINDLGWRRWGGWTAAGGERITYITWVTLTLGQMVAH